VCSFLKDTEKFKLGFSARGLWENVGFCRVQEKFSSWEDFRRWLSNDSFRKAVLN
jgi:hypothetical protein